jgi:hypothetical protein
LEKNREERNKLISELQGLIGIGENQIKVYNEYEKALQKNWSPVRDSSKTVLIFENPMEHHSIEIPVLKILELSSQHLGIDSSPFFVEIGREHKLMVRDHLLTKKGRELRILSFEQNPSETLLIEGFYQPRGIKVGLQLVTNEAYDWVTPEDVLEGLIFIRHF